MDEWEGTKYGLLPNMAGKHELEKIKLREEITKTEAEKQLVVNNLGKAYAEITRLKEELAEQKSE